MPTFNEFVEEISTDFSSFAESGDIDRSTIKRNVILQMKKFGNNIMPICETVLDVKNSQATLPENFRSLKLALKCEPFGMTVTDAKEEDLDKAFFYSRRLENPAYYNEVTHEYVDSCKTKLIEEVVFLNTGKASVYYNPQWLKVTPSIKRSGYAADCLNLSKAIRNTNCHEISINNFTLQANFSEGKIYLQFYGFEVDEDGEIIIPDGWHGNLEQHLEYYCKAIIAENLIANNKNPQALGQLLPYYNQKAKEFFQLAQTEWKFSALGNTWENKMRIQNRRYFTKFNLPRM